MAVKTPGSLVLPMLLLIFGLLLSGCAEKDQAVPEAVERSDFSSAGSSASGSVAGGTDEVGDIAPDEPGGPSRTGPADAGGAGMNDIKSDIKEDVKNGRKGKAEEAGGGAKTAPAAKAPDAGDDKSGVDEEPAGNKDLQGGSGNEVPKNNAGDSGENMETRKESAAPVTDGDKPVEIKFSEMYSGSSSRGLKFSDKLTDLDGKKVVITGYMAPPLKPSFTFFVLTRQPMAICPFCSTDASWPEDIILVYLPEGEDRTPTDSVLTVTGTLELGSRTDPDTGFVSQVRIHSDKIKIVR